jgi:hypothetical protein
MTFGFGHRESQRPAHPRLVAARSTSPGEHEGEHRRGTGASREVFPLEGIRSQCSSRRKQATRARRAETTTADNRAGYELPVSGGALCRPHGEATASAGANSNPVA